MNKLKVFLLATAWVLTAIFLAPIWVPVAIVLSTTLLIKNTKVHENGI
jgi:hypothetical protein